MKYYLSFLFFVLLILFSVYGVQSFTPGFSINWLLIFLVIIFPLFPYWFSFSLSFITAIILDAIRGGTVNFVALLITLFLGVIILHFLEKNSPLSRIVLGFLMISCYFGIVFAANYFGNKINLSAILFFDYGGTLLFYLLISLIKSRLILNSHALRLH